MISKSLQDIINEQITKEMYSAYLYLSMAAYFETRNLSGFSNWMRIQFEEEQAHALKMFDYINERGGKVAMGAIDAPKHDWSSILEVFEETLLHEQSVTASLNKIADLADEEKDRPTINLMNWFIDEQVEEENNVENILDQLKLINGEGHGLLMLDRELASRVFTPLV